MVYSAQIQGGRMLASTQLAGDRMIYQAVLSFEEILSRHPVTSLKVDHAFPKVSLRQLELIIPLNNSLFVVIYGITSCSGASF